MVLVGRAEADGVQGLAREQIPNVAIRLNAQRLRLGFEACRVRVDNGRQTDETTLLLDRA